MLNYISGKFPKDLIDRQVEDGIDRPYDTIGVTDTLHVQRNLGEFGIHIEEAFGNSFVVNRFTIFLVTSEKLTKTPPICAPFYIIVYNSDDLRAVVIGLKSIADGAPDLIKFINETLVREEFNYLMSFQEFTRRLNAIKIWLKNRGWDETQSDSFEKLVKRLPKNYLKLVIREILGGAPQPSQCHHCSKCNIDYDGRMRCTERKFVYRDSTLVLASRAKVEITDDGEGLLSDVIPPTNLETAKIPCFEEGCSCFRHRSIRPEKKRKLFK